MVWRSSGGGPVRRAPSSGSLYGSGGGSGYGSTSGYGSSPPNAAPLSTSPSTESSPSAPWRLSGVRMSKQGSFIGPYSGGGGGSRSSASLMELAMAAPQEPARKEFVRTWSDDVIRVVFISDTHSLHPKIVDTLPQGDVLVHGGDFSNTGTKHQIEAFRDFLEVLPHPTKVVVAGNHDLTFHESYYETIGQQRFHSKAREGPYFPAECRRLITDLQKSHQVYYLENKDMYLPGTPIRVWGTPWTPAFGDWAFNYEPRGDFCKTLYAGIPEKVDILITHGPPYKVGDRICSGGDHVGCPELLREVKTRVKPRIHIFGHIHECHGVFQDEEGILYLNASTCDLQYRPNNGPIVLDVPRDKSKPVEVVSSHTVRPVNLSGTPWETEVDISDHSGATTEEDLDLELEIAASNLSISTTVTTVTFSNLMESRRGVTPPIKEEDGPMIF